MHLRKAGKGQLRQLGEAFFACDRHSDVGPAPRCGSDEQMSQCICDTCRCRSSKIASADENAAADVLMVPLGSQAGALGRMWRFLSRLEHTAMTLDRDRSSAEWEVVLGRLLKDFFGIRKTTLFLKEGNQFVNNISS